MPSGHEPIPGGSLDLGQPRNARRPAAIQIIIAGPALNVVYARTAKDDIVADADARSGADLVGAARDLR